MFAKYSQGRPTNPAEKAVSLMRYIPKARRVALPHEFFKHNMMEKDAKAQWDVARYGMGPGEPYGGYANMKSFKLRGEPLQITPKSELERFMPDISISNKAAVTPVSLMSARGGHRVTHDLLHTYDPLTYSHSARAAPEIDHDNIVPEDPNRVGIHPNTFGCRSAIFRWLRRSPFSDEKMYYERATKKNGRPVANEAERDLHQRIIRHAKNGQLQMALEDYRRLVHHAPTEVYRALLAACVPQGLIADAVSIFNEGNMLDYAARDFECMRSLLRTAVAARNVARVMWVMDILHGYFAHKVAAVELEPIHMNQLMRIAIAFTLDNGYGDEARELFSMMRKRGYLDYDLHEQLGFALREAIAKNETANLPADFGALAAVRDAVDVQTDVARTWYARLEPHQLAAFPAISKGDMAATVAAFRRAYGDADVDFVLRAARFEDARDLLATDAVDRYVDRVLAWLDQLSDWRVQADTPLPYLLKSKPANGTSSLVRIATTPAETKALGRLSATESGHKFWYSPEGTRFVEETYPTLNADSNVRKYLVRTPIQREIPIAIRDLSQGAALEATAKQARPAWIVHASVDATEALSAGGPAPSSSPAAGTTGAATVNPIGESSRDPGASAF